MCADGGFVEAFVEVGVLLVKFCRDLGDALGGLRVCACCRILNT